LRRWDGFPVELHAYCCADSSAQIIRTSPPFEAVDDGADVFALRKRLAATKKSATIAASANSAVATFVEEDREALMRDGASIKVRLHSPKSPSADGCPGLVIYHGGGFCLGDADNELVLCRRWTDLGGIAVNVEYRLAPENPFPVGVQDAYDALIWVSLNPPRSRLVIMADIQLLDK
jgi:acetyl esterase/lipase